MKTYKHSPPIPPLDRKESEKGFRFLPYHPPGASSGPERGPLLAKNAENASSDTGIGPLLALWARDAGSSPAGRGR